ncbi:hypothetical protein BO78DRAFT_231127 [Aspergillus sclerotiicarbonarius CBS 121057]|uniref:Uncharacterized protein n=1 Tax=Aspergillus sclerotiicarbonarius (strain CBS 121057 / IBT 28362) TaxID=1448318 RepID=A0A319DW45_ASPSB|nr:hypothetical protein BO78DRAFT_231127 [Aspergillus sclerotiicarbonarius CBS 121057]
MCEGESLGFLAPSDLEHAASSIACCGISHCLAGPITPTSASNWQDNCTFSTSERRDPVPLSIMPALPRAAVTPIQSNLSFRISGGNGKGYASASAPTSSLIGLQFLGVDSPQVNIALSRQTNGSTPEALTTGLGFLAHSHAVDWSWTVTKD